MTADSADGARNVSAVRHPDMPGERVTFEIGYEGRRMVARSCWELASTEADLSTML